MPQRPGTPDTLLCERCGYPIDRLDTATVCPECGKPIAESLPTWRPGSPWQNHPRPRTLVGTAWRTLRDARGLFQTIRLVLGSQERWLLAAYIAASTILPLLCWVSFASSQHPASRWWYTRTTGTGPRTTGASATMEAFLFPWTPLAIVIACGGLAWIILLLTWIETLGVRFFGARRGWRVTKTIAWSVCAHASVGWIVGGLLYAVSPWIVLAARPIYDLFPPALAVRIASTAATWTPIAGFFAGMLAFETLVYIGIRECRFANEPGRARSVSPTNPG